MFDLIFRKNVFDKSITDEIRPASLDYHSFKQKYGSGKIHTVVANAFLFRNSRFMRTVRSNRHSCYSFVMFGHNKSIFTELFGNHHYVYDGEVRYYNWALEFGGRTFIVFSDSDGSDMGTSFEMVLRDGENFDNVITNKEIGNIVEDFAIVMFRMLKDAIVKHDDPRSKLFKK